jgi:hypothetical protein
VLGCSHEGDDGNVKKRARTDWLWWVAAFLASLLVSYAITHCSPESSADFFKGERQ